MECVTHTSVDMYKHITTILHPAKSALSLFPCLPSPSPPLSHLLFSPLSHPPALSPILPPSVVSEGDTLASRALTPATILDEDSMTSTPPSHPDSSFHSHHHHDDKQELMRLLAEVSSSSSDEEEGEGDGEGDGEGEGEADGEGEEDEEEEIGE